jgi:hypothetical protein
MDSSGRYEGDLDLYYYQHPLPAGLTSVGGTLSPYRYQHPLPAGLTSVGGLYLEGYDHPLPAGLTSVRGDLGLYGYNHPLPSGLTSVGRDLNLYGYDLPLPAGLTYVGRDLNPSGYKHLLPAGLATVRGNLNLYNYNHPLPSGLKSVGGDLRLYGYDHPLPAGLTYVGRALELSGYNHPLPAGLTSVGGNLDLRGYNHPLPAGLTRVGSIALPGYKFPLPAGLKSVRSSLVLDGYKFPLPAGLKSVQGALDLHKYDHPLPESLTNVGRYLALKGYNHPLPAGLKSVEGALELDGYNHPLPAGLTVDGEIIGYKNYPFALPSVTTTPMRAYGKRSAAVLKLRRPDAPRAARDFKRMFPAEFESIKGVTEGRDFTTETAAKVKAAYVSPIEWAVTFGKYSSDLQRLCGDANDVIRLNIDISSDAFTDEQRETLRKVQEASKRSGHPVARAPLFTVGWVRYCADDDAKTWLVEEVQSGVPAVRKGLKDPDTRHELESGGVSPERVEETLDLLAPYVENFYEDALGITFDLAQQKGYHVEMMEFEKKRDVVLRTGEDPPPRDVYTRLPPSMGMKLSPGSSVLPDEVPATWKITPNRRRASRRKTSRRSRKTSRS